MSSTPAFHVDEVIDFYDDGSEDPGRVYNVCSARKTFHWMELRRALRDSDGARNDWSGFPVHAAHIAEYHDAKYGAYSAHLALLRSAYPNRKFGYDSG